MKVNILNNRHEFFKNRLLSSGFTDDVYYSGTLPSQQCKTIGIIGARKATPYGSAVTRELTFSLQDYKIHVISGLAIGIDSLAHRYALESNLLTSAVVPGTIENIYPPSNRNLAQKIIDRGGSILTLHKEEKRLYPDSFHARNQLLAAMCDAILVIEAAKRSGTMITVRFGLEMGKTVLAVPGRITDAMSEGTNRLISQGATPVLSGEDIIEALGLEYKQQQLFYDGPHKELLKRISEGISDINQLQSLSELDARNFNSALTDLELDEIIKIEAGHVYKRGLA